MFILFRYKKNGLPSGLIKLHEFLLEDTISYFEKSKPIRKRVREARKTIKQAFRFAKKKKVYPSSKIDRAFELIEELQEELNYTHQAIEKSAAEMEKLIVHIKGERVTAVYSLISDARDHFRQKKIEKRYGTSQASAKAAG